MNLNELLSQVLEIANYPKDRQEGFVRDFYNYYFTKLIDTVGGADPSLAQKILYAFDHYKENPDGLNNIWAQMETDPRMKEIVDRVSIEVINELIDDIAKYATDEQKQQILAAVNKQPNV